MSHVSPVSPLPTRIRAYSSARADGEPKLFSIDEEVFACLPRCPGLVYLDASRRLDAAGDDQGRQGMATIGLVRDFLEAVLLRDDAGEHGDVSSHDRFMTLLRSPERIVEAQLLGDIMRDLMEDYAGRPLPQPSPSPD